MKSVAINVGANSDTPGGRGPLYEDGTFRFVPITEGDSHKVSEPSYRELGVDDVRPSSSHDEVAHFDPEFPDFDYGQNYTYGDRHATKTRYLEKLEEGDYLFFFATLDFEGTSPMEYWINPGWGGYIFGHFQLQRDPLTIDEYHNLPKTEKQAFENNAHLRRKDQDDDLLLILGNKENSLLYETPTPLTLPRKDLKGNDKASHFLSRDDINIRSGFWYRGPIEFGHDTTQTLLTAQNESNFTPLYGPPLEEQPGARDFRDNLHPPSDFSDLREILAEQTNDPEEQCLATFAYIAGGFRTRIPETILSKQGLGATSIVEAADKHDQLREVLTETIEDLRRENKTWYHGHRKNIATRAGKLRPDGERLETYQAEVIVRAITSCAEQVQPALHEYLRSFEGPDAFAQALSEFRRIDTFQRLGAFDLLEAFVQANDYDWLAPHQLRYPYVDSVGPKRGLEHVFGVTNIDSVETTRREGMLTQLMAYACDTEGLSTKDAVFAAESALCNCQK